MKAMILAAGLGTRLRPLTDDRPKALVEVAGRTLLEIALMRLKSIGVGEVMINVHHFGDMVVEYLRAKLNFGMRVEISREDVLLDTGGGLKQAGWFFLETPDEAFLLHNVDVISNIDLLRMVEAHDERQALATVAVQRRETSRYLLFDEELQLCGRRAGHDGELELARPSQHVQALAFSGIHVICPRLLTMMNEEGAFSIITTYLRLAGSGEKIEGFPVDAYYWRDVGKPDSLRQAAEDLERKALVP